VSARRLDIARVLVAGPDGDRGWVRRLTFDYDQAGWNTRTPKWSPDGTTILFREAAGSPQARVDERTGARDARLMLLTFDCA
jgi:Tol biopolymer transport system component